MANNTTNSNEPMNSFFASETEEPIPTQSCELSLLEIQKQKQRGRLFWITIIFCASSYIIDLFLGYNLFSSETTLIYGKELFYVILTLFIVPSVLLLNLIKGCYQSDKIDDIPTPTKLLLDHLQHS